MSGTAKLSMGSKIQAFKNGIKCTDVTVKQSIRGLQHYQLLEATVTDKSVLPWFLGEKIWFQGAN